MSALVLKSWKADYEVVSEENNHISIRGREAGLLSWFLALVKIDPSTKMDVSERKVRFTVASLSGSTNRLIPLERISSTYYGHHKPWKEALILGLVLGSFTMGIGAIVGLIYYFLNKTLTIGIVEYSGVVNSIQFKRSVLENVTINEDEAKRVCDIVQHLIEAKVG